jgi:5-methylthioadenosine/S-adenosylhomocysteine deaminase
MDADRLLECYRHLIDHWHDRAGGRLRAAVSCSAPHRVTAEYFRSLDALSESHNLPFYVHILETKVQRVFGEERLRRSLVRYVHELGLLSDRLNIIHGIWLDDADVDLIAASGCLIAHNPISNLRLGSGIMPFRAICSRGIPLCLGTDEAITDDAVNMWNVMKFTGLIHNITHPDYETWPTAREVLHCAIAGGVQAMRSPRPIGAISPGHQADLVLIDLDTLPFTPLNDLRRQLVYCENGSSVRMTLVNGRIVFEDGRITTVDEAAIRAEARELFANSTLAARGPGGYDASEWAPYYREMYLRAAGKDTGMTRWACQDAASGSARPRMS